MVVVVNLTYHVFIPFTACPEKHKTPANIIKDDMLKIAEGVKEERLHAAPDLNNAFNL